MPSIINATTTNGVAISPDNSGSLQLATNNGTTAVTIDTSQNVGIGTSSPTSKLHVKDGAVNIENTSGYGVIEMGGSSGAFLDMKNPFSDDYDLRLQTDGSTAFLITAGSIPLTFQTNSTERMRIDSSGNVGIGTTATDGVLTVNKANAGHKIVATNGTNAAWSEIGSYAGATNQVKAQLFAEENGASSYVKIGARSNHYCAFTTNDTERMRITSGGELGYLCTGLDGDRPNAVGSYKQTNGNTKVRVVSDGSAAFQFYSPTGGSGGPVGSIVPNASSVSYNTTSDYRLKENIAPMTGALEKVAQLKPCTYTWKVNGAAGQGFIAHELQEVVPDCVTGEKDAVNSEGNPVYQAVDTSFLVATLTAAIQELKAELDTVKAELASTTLSLADAKAELNTLKNPPVEGTE